MKRFLTWLGRKLSSETNDFDDDLRQRSAGIRPVPVRVKPPAARLKPRHPAAQPAAADMVEFSTEKSGSIADGGPGKNVLVRNRFIREDTGTHETLKIVDDSILESEEKEAEFDPYNTGRFDRGKSWDGPSRK
jgi:hypothetical protein